MVETRHPEISLRRQCELLGLSRSSLYYCGQADLRYNEELMRLLDEQYLQTPFYGVPRMTAWLRRQGHAVNEKRVRRLLRLMGLEAIYPRRKQGLSQADRQHKVYPYLLRDLEITHPNQVWAADITYIRMARGWVYLMAILDWFSRYVVAWDFSITLEADFCVTTLQRALTLGRPEIFNTDQGSQFTSDDWIKTLKDAQVADVCLTSFSSSGCGGASRWRKSISTTTKRSGRFGTVWGGISPSTMKNVRTRR